MASEENGKKFVRAGATKYNTGRGHTTLNDEVIKSVCNHLRLGSYVETSFALAGVPKGTYLTWIQKGAKQAQAGEDTIFAKLSLEIDKAQAEAETRDLLIIDKCANGQEWEYERHPKGARDSKGNDISGHLVLNARGNPIPKKIGLAPNWNASAWRLERRFPRRWGRLDRLETSGPEGKPQVVVHLPSNGREVNKPVLDIPSNGREAVKPEDVGTD